MANDIIHRNILHNFDSVQTKHSRSRHAQNQQQNHGGCRHKYRIFTNDSEQ